MSKKLVTSALATAVLMLGSSVSFADTSCSHRGVLDDKFCDENQDLVADQPKDESKWRNPSTLVFTYTPVEDPAVYKDAFANFQKHLEEKTGKRVVYYTVHSNAA